MDQLAEEHTYGPLLLHMLMVTHSHNITVAAPTLTRTGHTPCQITWETTTSATVMDSTLREVDWREEMKMMIYGMGKDVAQAAVAANGRTHLTSASNSTTPHLRTWK